MWYISRVMIEIYHISEELSREKEGVSAVKTLQNDKTVS